MTILASVNIGTKKFLSNVVFVKEKGDILVDIIKTLEASLL